MPVPTNIRIRTSLVAADLKWTTPKELIEALPKWLTAEIEGAESLHFVNFGHETPSVDENNYPWIRLDEDGRPMGLYVYYEGAWVRAWSYAVGELRLYTGAVADIEDGWVLCDGNNGTDDLTASMVPSGVQTSYDLAFVQYVGYA